MCRISSVLMWCVFFAFQVLRSNTEVVDSNFSTNGGTIGTLPFVTIVIVVASTVVLTLLLFHFLLSIDNMHEYCATMRLAMKMNEEISADDSIQPNRKQCITAEKSVWTTNLEIQMRRMSNVHKTNLYTFFSSVRLFCQST